MKFLLHFLLSLLAKLFFCHMTELEAVTVQTYPFFLTEQSGDTECFISYVACTRYFIVYFGMHPEDIVY